MSPEAEGAEEWWPFYVSPPTWGSLPPPDDAALRLSGMGVRVPMGWALRGTFQ